MVQDPVRFQNLEGDRGSGVAPGTPQSVSSGGAPVSPLHIASFLWLLMGLYCAHSRVQIPEGESHCLAYSSHFYLNRAFSPLPA